MIQNMSFVQGREKGFLYDFVYRMFFVTLNPKDKFLNHRLKPLLNWKIMQE